LLIQDENIFDGTLVNKLYDYYTSVSLFGHEVNKIIQLVTFRCGEGNGTNIRRLAASDAVAMNCHGLNSKIGMW
jgi:hypothetical protein